MKKIVGALILVIACVGAFFIARPWLDKPPLVKSDVEATVEHQVKNIAETTAEGLVAQAEAEKTPDQPLSEALRNVAKKETAKVFANAGSVKERRLEASPQFRDFYYSDAETTAERLLAQAEAEKIPGQPLAEALRNITKKETAEVFANAGSVEERRLEASLQFSGFYYINTLFRKNYCQKLGVDISSFVAAFEKENAGSYNEAHKIWLKEGIDVEAEMKEEAEKGSFEFVIDTAMKNTAQEKGLSLPQTCQMFAGYANELSKSLSLEVVMPQTYDVLHDK